MTSVCTGALVYGDAGLLDRRPLLNCIRGATALETDIKPRLDQCFVDDGQVITAAGVSAGIDMALHLIVRLASPDKAREVRRYIEYDPQPPV
jgi:transcriptional regulator GlxA family with amidase domain